MRRHPEIGRQMIERIPFLQGAVPIVHHHHERWDGSGYPLSLRGEAIPLGARIFAAADAFDAMTFDRPYSRALSLEAARCEIRRCAGTHFDPAVVETFLGIPMETLASIQRAEDMAPGGDPTGSTTFAWAHHDGAENASFMVDRALLGESRTVGARRDHAHPSAVHEPEILS